MGRSGRKKWAVAAAVLGMLALIGCRSDPESVRPAVTAANAYTAIVRWEIDQTEPVVDDNGEEQAPVIYVAGGSGVTVDVAVQAAVVSAIDEDAVVRFTDDVRDAVDEGLEGEPVKDEGVMIVVDDFEVGQLRADTRISRYRSADDATTWRLDITADAAIADGAGVTAATPTDDTTD